MLTVFTAFFFPSLNAAVEGVSSSEFLRPLFSVIPYAFLGSLISAMVYYGFKGN